MAEFTAHFFYKFRFIFLWFFLTSSAKNLLGFRQNLSSSQISRCVFFCFVKNVEIKKVFGEIVSDNFSNSWLKNLHASGLYKIFPPFFPFRSRIFFIRAERLDAASSRAPPLWHALPCPSAAREPHQKSCIKKRGRQTQALVETSEPLRFTTFPD